MEVIGIIPAKKHSQRLPHKNTMTLGGKMLFEWSVEYALQEGVRPIISTDDDEVMRWCGHFGVDFVREDVDDSDMCNCINQVLRQYTCDRFVLLQPTSPLRQSGLLKNILKMDFETSVYTCNKVKIIGHIGDKFNLSYRDQDSSTKFLYHFDGNMVVVNTSWYEKSSVLFDDSSLHIEQPMPYVLQVDTKEDFETIEKIVG